jgi:WD40 repeat protein
VGLHHRQEDLQVTRTWAAGRPWGRSFTADGKHFLSWGSDLFLRKWDVATGKVALEHALRPKGFPDEEPARSQKLEKDILQGRFSPDGNRFVLAAGNQTHMFDVASGKDLYQLPNEGGYVVSLAISPDSRMLLTSAVGKWVATKLPGGGTLQKNHPICLWELSTRKTRMQIVLPDGGAGSVAFSPDGKRFAVATGDPQRRIRLWDTTSGKEADAIQGYRGDVRSLAFSPDGSRLISGMDDTAVLVWDLSSKGK